MPDTVVDYNNGIVETAVSYDNSSGGIFVKETELAQAEVGDLNGDDTINVVDLMIILRRVSGRLVLKGDLLLAAEGGF